MTQLAWVSVSATTGQLIADLPDLDMSGQPLQTSLNRYDTTQVSLPIPTAPVNWTDATREYASTLIATSTVDAAPLWGGIVVEAAEVGADPGMPDEATTQLQLAGLESWFDRIYITDNLDYSTSTWGDAQILADLISRYVAPHCPIRVVLLAPGTTRQLTYAATDGTSVYSAMQTMSGLAGGPEWVVTWEWFASNTAIRPVITFGGGGVTVGASVPAGRGPATTFDLPGCVQAATRTRSYAAGKGANTVVAVSSGQGAAAPTSTQTAADMQGRLPVTYRYTPAQSLSQADLDAHAAGALAVLAEGQATLALTLAVQGAPVYGLDWAIGDQVGYDLTSQVWPNGLSGVSRVISVQFTEQTITPILYVPPVPS